MNKKTDQQWKESLTPEQYKMLRQKETEAPFTGKYLQEKSKGVYKCVGCGNPLFSSDTKFDSQTGWPSFDNALPNAIKQREDNSHGMHRIEVVCSICESHLGHLFDDGPTETKSRYCINSSCLDLEKEEQVE